MKKTLLLTAVLLLTVGGTLYFYKTRLDPPSGIMSERQYIAEAQALVDDVGTRLSAEKLDQRFVKAAHAISLMAADSLLGESDADAMRKDLAERYVSTWTRICFDKFKTPDWGSDDIVAMQERVGDLKRLVYSDGSRVIDRGSAENDRIDSVFAVTKSYEAAVAFARNCRYVSVEKSKEQMEQVEAYKRHHYLRHNAVLTDSLSNVGRRLDKGHYESLGRRVSALKNPGDRDKEEYDSLYNGVIADINDYRDNAKRLYGYSHEVGELKSLASINREIALMLIRSRRLYHFEF